MMEKNITTFSSVTLINILDEMSDVVIISKDFKNFWVNQAFCDLFGYTKQEAIGKGPELVLDSKYVKILSENYKKKIVKEEGTRKYEAIAYTKDKKKIHINMSTKILKLENDIYVLTLINDITSEKRILDNLINSEKVYRYSLENTPVPVIIHSEGNVVFINSAALKVIGEKDESKIINKPVIDFVHPDSRKKAIERIRIMTKTGKLSGFEIEKFILPNGREIEVEVFAFPINYRGRLSFQVYFTDITERIKNEKALKESEEKFRLLFERLPIGTFLYDKNFIVTDANRSFEIIVNSKREEIIGIDLMNLDDKSFVSEISKTANKTDGFYEGKYKTTVSGKEIYVIVNTAPILDGKGDFDGGICIFTDITKQKELESQFIQAQKLEAVGRLTGGIAHDFNNILTVIKGYSDLILKRTDSEDENYRRIEEIKKAGDRATDFIQQLMAFSRKQIVKADIVFLPELLNELKGMITRLIGEETKFEIDTKGSVGAVYADKSQLNQVIMNLIVNAKDAIDERDIPDFEKNIRIEVGEVFLDEDFVANNPGSKIGYNVSLSIMDNGMGIKKEIIDKIFEPFYTTKKNGKGTGLGLSTVYGIVKQNNGYIYVKSEAENWTVFTVLLPLEKDIRTKRVVEEKNKINLGKNKKILIVEDETSVRNYLYDSLSDYGFVVDVVDNGLAALEKIQKHSDIDCVISDVVMPVMDGEKLAESLREEYPSIKIILMSGYTASDSLLNKIKEKDYIFIKKPFIIDDLINLI